MAEDVLSHRGVWIWAARTAQEVASVGMAVSVCGRERITLHSLYVLVMIPCLCSCERVT